MVIELAHRDLHRVPDAAGLPIHCQAGSVWITLDHDTRDIVLEPGQSFATPEHRRALIFALEPACVSIGLPPGGRQISRKLPARAENLHSTALPAPA